MDLKMDNKHAELSRFYKIMVMVKSLEKDKQKDILEMMKDTWKGFPGMFMAT